MTTSAPGQSNYSSTLSVEELSSDTGSSSRIVQLVGGGLPLMGAEWAGENKLVTKWYPGNADEATQQNLGPRELPSSWSGDWRRTVLSRTPCTLLDGGGATLVVDPSVLRDALEDIFRVGRRLRVTWSVDGGAPGATGKVVREGRAGKWKFKHTRMQDIEWEVTFEWVGRGGTSQKVASTRDDSLSGAQAALAVAANAVGNLALAASFSNVRTTIPLSASSFSLGQLEAFANGPLNAFKSVTSQIQAGMSKLNQLGDVVATIRGMPDAFKAQASAIAADVAEQARQFTDKIGATPGELQSATSRPADVARAYATLGRAAGATSIVARQASALASSVRARAHGNAPLQGRQSPQAHTLRPQDVKATYVTKRGDTPSRLSSKFYGTPDHAVDILLANRLPLYQPTFAPGKVLIIPTLPTTGNRSY